MKNLTLLLALMIPVNIYAQFGGGEKYPDLKPNSLSMERFEKMRFGIFIHWGPSTLRGTSSWGRGNHPYDFTPRVPINIYDSLYLEFNPVLFSAEDWVSTVKQSGAGYFVFVTKHHDGFCLFNSKYTEYDMMSTPYKVDVLDKLSDECKKQGIVFGTYYSICDWHHPEYPGRYGGDPRPVESSDMNKYREYLYHQMDELVDRYDSEILWFDGSWEAPWTHEDGMDLYKYLRDKKNDIIINNRVDKKQDPKQDREILARFAGDFKTPEQEIGEYDIELPWESCMTITERGWHFVPQARLKSLQELVNTLVQTAGGGGNLLLNIGPMPDGRMDMFHKKRLLEIGDWLKENGESIYETEGGPFRPNEYSASTRKGNKIYLHILDWPSDTISIPVIEQKIIKSYVLNGKSFDIVHRNGSMEVSLPADQRKKINTILVLETGGDALQLQDKKPAEFKNIITATLITEPSHKFPGEGGKTLINKKPADPANLYQEWLGFEGGDFSAVIDLQVEKEVSRLEISFLDNQDQWIFMPAGIEVLLSDDNKNYVSAGKIKISLKKSENSVRRTVDIPLTKNNTRYIKVNVQNTGTCPEWHKGAGGKAWLFVDEVNVD